MNLRIYGSEYGQGGYIGLKRSCGLYESTELAINQSVVHYVLQILRNGLADRSARLRTFGVVYGSIPQS